ncbi:LysR family transcriptional regulator [Desulfobacca acetoxidans]|uniref:Transcriptional regulator, LysR family n=1 Tax=Desulfobacca acetoxidans (strain ATCC 700848 / DSM 11109 / ASRB2) TaxID=880072 RepID=F2NC78_DESAR|nr:LysR family transcriptional regulator [Desulfobacca acetoxidans]AEB08873.1 transcriptional regulator, LysR family [Desulfobacca acetoxidans DSM 11109]
MEWQQLLGFYQVAKLGSFTRAGEATYRSQSALSQQVKALEEELACPLLERIGRQRLRLTPVGELVFRFAETIFALSEQLQAELKARQGGQIGRLTLAAPFTTIYHLFPKVLRFYREQFPQVQLTILDRSQSEVITLVRSGEVDMGIVSASQAPPDLTARRWLEVETFLLTPVGHPLTREPEVTMAEIARYPLILPPKTPTYPRRSKMEEELKRLGLEYHIIMESSNVELSSLYVEMGLGITLATLVKKELPELHARQLAFLPLTHYFPPDWITVLMRKNKLLTSYQSAFLNILLGKIQGCPSDGVVGLNR